MSTTVFNRRLDTMVATSDDLQYPQIRTTSLRSHPCCNSTTNQIFDSKGWVAIGMDQSLAIGVTCYPWCASKSGSHGC